MPHSTNKLNERSVLQLTLWRGSTKLRRKFTDALAALGGESQSVDLTKLGRNFIAFLRSKRASFTRPGYPTLAGYCFSSAYYDEQTAEGCKPGKRSARIVSKKVNGFIIRGFGDVDEGGEVTIVISRLSSEQWRRLAIGFGWDPDRLNKTANAPGISLYVRRTKYMSLLDPTAWA